MVANFRKHCKEVNKILMEDIDVDKVELVN
jgi:hypothetical protein